MTMTSIYDFGWYDKQLERDDLTLADLASLKDSLLAIMAQDIKTSFDVGCRLSRINLRFKTAGVSAASGVPRDTVWAQHFVDAAKRLLDPAILEMLKREATARMVEAEASTVAAAPSTAVVTTTPPPLPRKAVAPPGRRLVKGTLTPRKLDPAKSPPALAAVPARLANLAEVAAVRAIRFDPTPLFKEFGRERVLTLWASLQPEQRPETGAEMRKLLLAERVKGYFAEAAAES